MWNLYHHVTKVCCVVTILERDTTVSYLSSSGLESETCDHAQEDEKQ